MICQSLVYDEVRLVGLFYSDCTARIFLNLNWLCSPVYTVVIINFCRTFICPGLIQPKSRKLEINITETTYRRSISKAKFLKMIKKRKKRKKEDNTIIKKKKKKDFLRDKHINIWHSFNISFKILTLVSFQGCA